MLQSLLCPACGVVIAGGQAPQQATCPRCGYAFEVAAALPLTDFRPDPDNAADQVVKAHLRDAVDLLNTDITSPDFDKNIVKARELFSQVLHTTDNHPQGWLGLFQCCLCETLKTFLSTPRFGNTGYWLTIDRTTSFELYQMNSCFCRLQVIGYKNDVYVVDEVLQPGRKAEMYLGHAVENAPEEMRPGLEAVKRFFFDTAMAQLPAVGLEAIGEFESQRAQRGKDGGRRRR